MSERVTACTHLSQVADVDPQPPEGCAECLASGGRWVHLRECLTCGHVGCCDSSPSRHATAHYRTAGHPIVTSYEPGEDWVWCYPDGAVVGTAARPPGQRGVTSAT
jgi:uncharacterized UBP type Zn finger protein